MRIPRVSILLALIGFVACTEKEDEFDTAELLSEATKSFLANKDALGGVQQMFNGFVNPDANKLEMGERSPPSTIGAKMLQEGFDFLTSAILDNKKDKSAAGANVLSMIGPTLQMLSLMNSPTESPKSNNEVNDERSNSGDFDFASLLNVASMFAGKDGNMEGLAGLLPIFLESMGGGDSTEADKPKMHDHSSHSWFMPPVLENVHVIWEHFRNSELAQTLWRNSGLEHIFSNMVDQNGTIKYEKMFDSFENPSLRRKWIRSMTNFVAEWVAHISEPSIRQKYLKNLQFISNGFLKSQGYPKGAMFDAAKPVESLSRLVNTGARRHLNLEVDSQQYIKPAVAYVQDLMKLASERGFIMSRVNANELSNRLSETINNDLISPLLKAYRAYKWAVKSPKCAKHVLCSINERSNEIEDQGKMSEVRATLTKGASYLAAWMMTRHTGDNFWSLYGAIQESDGCFLKYPVDCEEFHSEEIRVTTEAAHSEL